MSVIAIDTSTSCMYLCLKDENKYTDVSKNDKNHSENLLPEIKSLLKKSSTPLSAIYIANGPGSFTGLRISSSTAKGISSALSIPIYCISTLQAYAKSAEENIDSKTLIVPIIDARKDRLYSAIFYYYDEKIERISEDEDISLSDLISKIENIDCECVCFVCAECVYIEPNMIKKKTKILHISSCKNPAHSILELECRLLQKSEGPVYIRPIDAVEYVPRKE